MESIRNPTNSDDAENTLSQLQNDRVSLARATSPPAWFAVVTGLLAAAFILVFGLAAEWFIIGVTAVAIIFVVLGLFRQKIVGSESDPWADRSARGIGLLILAVAVVAAIATIVVYSFQSSLWILVVGAILVGGLAFLAAMSVARRAIRAASVAG